ncbi:Protein BPS1, chloroplastic [Morella rubra]|uniref:Protein BPS1, chloroplastic n=1 Tax=Morella rubra TaxID=262757 RepID=A0A6A1WHZ3_9ROSI|nr:Protein BPS1, chloroplastic [Morella rubra]
MVLLIERISKLYSKLENHHHHHRHDDLQSEAFSASLQAFESDVSNFLNQLLLNSKPGSEGLSLPWVQQCLGLLPAINKAFAKLVVEIDYPISIWEVASVEEYLNYSLSLLDLFNSISSSLAYLGQARLSLAHALSLVENSPSLAIERLKEIEPRKLTEDFRKGETNEDGQERNCLGKQRVVHQALIVMKSIGFWVCGIVLSGLCNDAKPYLEMRTPVGGFVSPSIGELDSRIYEIVMEKETILREVKELNDALACLVAALVDGKDSKATEELQGKLEVSEKLLDGLQKEVDHLFSDILAGRNKLLDCLRHRKL